MEEYEVLEDLKKHVLKEINKINEKGDLNPVELKNASDAVCLLVKIKEVEEDDFGESESSERYPHSMRRGSYRRGYSRHSINDRIVDKLERMMDDAGSEYERNVISGWISKVEAN